MSPVPGRKVTTGAGLAVPVAMHLRELPALEVVVVVPTPGTLTDENTLGALAAPATPGDHQGGRQVTGEDYHQRGVVWCPS